MGDYTIKNIYQGGISSLDPNSSYENMFTGYNIAAGELGAPAKADTANQIQQVNALLNQGIIPIEVGALDPRVFEQIPKQHFKEINRMAKLAGGKISLHAPIVEPTGISDQGWTESSRLAAEKQLIEAVTRSHDMDEEGGMPITMHSTGLPGVEYGVTPDGKEIRKLSIINQETGRIVPLEEEKSYFPGEGPKVKRMTPEDRLKSINNTEWDKSLAQIEFSREGAERILAEIDPITIGLYLKNMGTKGGLKPEELSPKIVHEFQRITSASEYLHQAELSLNTAFHNAYKFAPDEKTKENLMKASEIYGKKLGYDDGNRTIESFRPQTQSGAIHFLTQTLKSKENQPEIYVPVETFALEKASETFANVALKGYDEFGDKAPTISIENMFGGMAFGLSKQGEKGPPGMNELIMETKRQFVERAMQERSGGNAISKAEAEVQADKVIGMTFDVGHLNIAKKLGYDNEDLRKEAAAIAKHVKHVHLTDNFGFSDSHLPPGMGNVPFKELLGELEKAGTLKGTSKVVEAAGWPQHFGSSPLSIIYAGMGAPMTTEAGSPSWAQSPGLYQGYFGGFGMMLPQINYQTFGAGFSTLPQELGGQMPGQQGSRLGGTPLE